MVGGQKPLNPNFCCCCSTETGGEFFENWH